MRVYTCENCKKQFNLKGDYKRHMTKKYPCITQEELKNSSENKLEEIKQKYTETDSLRQLEQFFSKIRDLLRDEESISGDRALDVITDFLFLKLINDEFENNKHFIETKYNKSIKIANHDYDIDEYKKYFEWTELMNLIDKIDKDSSNQKNKQLLFDVVSSIIFSGILKFNEHTKDIYKNRRFFIKKIATVIRILKEYNKIDFKKFDVDIKGKAYELTLQKEASTNKDFGQFFTPRHIVNYMIENIEIKINKDGSYTKVMDPACGTCGILLSYYSKVKEKALKDKIKLDKDVSKYINGFEIVDDTLKLGQMNVLLKSNVYNTNLKNIDFLENGCLDFVDEKFNGHIIMNPPFALTKKYYLDNNEELNNFYKVKTKSGVMLFILASLNIVNDKKQIIVVSPNGKEIFSKTKELVNLRKYIVDNVNLYKIAINPENSFKPYTGVQTLILMMKKGSKTSEIEFVKLDKNNEKMSETKICKVSYEELKEKQFSWNYKEYIDDDNFLHKDIENKKIKDVLIFDKKSNKQASYGNEKGKYPFYTSSQKLTKYCDAYDYSDLSLILGTGGNPNVKISNNFSCSSDNIILKNNNENINLKYIYFYLINNMKILEDLFEGQTIKHLSKSNLEEINIPFPSIEKQNLIVEELNILNEDIKNLKVCIENRKIALKAKLNILLKKTNCEENKKIKNILLFDKKSKNNASYGKENGKYPFYTSSQNLKKYCDNFDYKDYSLIIGTGGNANIKLDKEFSCSADNFIIKNKDDNININYIYYYLLININILEELFQGQTIKHLSKEDLGNITIPVPSIEEQEKIVKELDIINNDIDCMKNSIKYLEQIIKDNFDYHLDMCKKENIKEDINKEDYEKIIIKEKEYIKEGDNVYKIKNNKKGKLYGFYEGDKLIKHK